MKLSTFSALLGLLFLAQGGVGLWKPAAFGQSLRRFPRSEGWGYFLMGLGTLWFLWNVQRESISDFAAYKSWMILGFGGVGIMACIYVRDFLAVRGLAIVLLLLAKFALDTARWHDSSWRLVISVLAYLWVVSAMWLTVSPWRLRDLLNWASADENRIRALSAFRIALGLFLLALGLTVFRQAA